MYVITGATGNIGGVIANKLLEQGKRVRAIARDAGRLQSLGAKGAEILSGSLEDDAFLTGAFQGATAVFAMNPPNLQAENLRRYQDRISQALASGLKQARISYVVDLSSVGAEVPKGTGPIAGLHAQEERFNQLEAHVLHLRPAFFMENLLAAIPMIRHMGTNGLALKGDLAIPMIATRDIGVVAAEHLLRLDFTGKSIVTLLGQRNLTMQEATRILGAAIGKPDLPYVQFGYEDAIQGMVQAGLSPDVAGNFVEMARAFNEGLIAPIARTPENTTPTSIEQFAEVFASAYNH
jgi:uncharacterized protein YbjT (DUF2867 family)